MEYAVMAAAILAVLALLLVLEWSRARKEERIFVGKLYERYGELSDKKYSSERFARMGSYYERHPEDGQLDDITWNDLGMDALFRRMNYTLSASGEEYLYYTLRTLKQEQSRLEHMEEVIGFFGENPDIRVQTQLELRRLGYTGKFSLYDYLDNLDYLGARSNRKNLLCDALFLVFIGLLWVNFQLGIAGLVALTLYNIVTYFSEKGEIDPYIVSFGYVIRLLEVCEKLEKQPIPVCAEEWKQLKEHGKRLQGIRRNSYWVMSATRGNASGDLLSVLADYIRMVFHVDLIKFNSMLRRLRGHIEDVDALIGIVGYVETAISVWIFRESMTDGYCRPCFVPERELRLEAGYHPLLTTPVKNSILAGRGVLLTGSNASGKSTFLKMVALNVILAQTINTCAAESYCAPFFRVYSSMALRDDLVGGESYYIVEIKSLKRVLDAAAGEGSPILCFVDEVLRGTNTVERIAASTQILLSLENPKMMCFAATHDIELTELLEEEYDNYHFEEEIRDGDISFPYRIRPRKAVTRNAIRLLELMGYDESIIEQASVQAEHFIRTGEWKNGKSD